MHFNEKSTRKMNWPCAALVTLWLGYKRKNIREQRILEINYSMCAKMKYRFYFNVYMYETNHQEKILFQQTVNNIQFVFSRNAIVYLKHHLLDV